MEHAKQGGKHETGDGDFHDWFAVPRVCIWGHVRLLRCCFLSLPRCRTRGKEIDTFRGSFAGWLTAEVAGRAILDTLCEVCNFLSPSGFTLGKGLFCERFPTGGARMKVDTPSGTGLTHLRSG